MHRQILLLILLSFRLSAADSEELGQHALEDEFKANEGTQEEPGRCIKHVGTTGMIAGATGVIFVILGGVGTGLVCPGAAAYEAQKVLCHLAVAGLSFGGAMVVGGIALGAAYCLAHTQEHSGLIDIQTGGE